MAYYEICDKCGANLDPGETCDCEMQEEQKQDFFSRNMKESAITGQYSFLWSRKEDSCEAETVG